MRVKAFSLLLRLLPPCEWAFAARGTNVAIVTEYNGSRLVNVT